MKLFTVSEANEILTFVRPQLEKIKREYEKMSLYRESARAAATAGNESGGGGMSGGSEYVKSLYEIGKHTTEIHELGIQLKDYTRGLIDFPSLREGRIVLLCWQFGDSDKLEWWHETDTGFAGRQPL